MQDAITSILTRYDLTGRYLDQAAREQLKLYFQSGLDRISLAQLINNKASFFIKEASAQLFEEQPELLRPGGNAYTTRRYAACIRDIEYYLRYVSYALIAGDNNILDERVLDGLKDTYNSLGVPISPTLRSIQLLQDVISEELELENLNLNYKQLLNPPFEHLIQALSEEDI